MNETWETEKMRGMRKKEKKGFYHEEKRASIMTSIGRNRGLKRGYNHNKNIEGFDEKIQEDFNEEDRKTRRRRQERSFEYGKKKQRRRQENAKNARRHKKVIATELTVNSSISILGMVYTLL